MIIRAGSPVLLAACFSLFTPLSSAADRAAMERAASAAMSNYRMACPDIDEPEIEHHLRTTGSSDGGSTSVSLLSSMSCYRAAYNFGEMWFHTDADGETKLVSFALPKIDFTYTEGSDSGVVSGSSFAGFQSQTVLSNSSYDSGSDRIVAGHRWRGLGDAFDRGSWSLDAYGETLLVEFDIDPTFNGETDPVPVVRNGLPVR